MHPSLEVLKLFIQGDLTQANSLQQMVWMTESKQTFLSAVIMYPDDFSPPLCSAHYSAEAVLAQRTACLQQLSLLLGQTHGQSNFNFSEQTPATLENIKGLYFYLLILYVRGARRDAQTEENPYFTAEDLDAMEAYARQRSMALGSIFGFKAHLNWVCEGLAAGDNADYLKEAADFLKILAKKSEAWCRVAWVLRFKVSMALYCYHVELAKKSILKDATQFQWDCHNIVSSLEQGLLCLYVTRALSEDTETPESTWASRYAFESDAFVGGSLVQQDPHFLPKGFDETIQEFIELYSLEASAQRVNTMAKNCLPTRCKAPLMAQTPALTH